MNKIILYNKIKNYNNMMYDSKLVKFSDFMSNKYNIVHRKLYNMALNKYIKEWLLIKKYSIEVKVISDKIMKTTDYNEKLELNNRLLKLNNYINNHKFDKKFIDGKYIYDVNTYKEFKDNCFIIELMNDEYWKPSICKIITKFKNKSNPNLTWQVDLSPYWNHSQNISKKQFSNKKISLENFKDAKLIGINYIQGKARLYSENIDKEFEVDFDELNGNDIQIDEDLLLDNTFTHIINENI